VLQASFPTCGVNNAVISYILMDKHTQEIFFVYLKPDGLETLLDDYHHKSGYIEKEVIIPYVERYKFKY